MIDENNRFIFVIDNGEYVFYDFKGKKANVLDMNQTEDMLNILANENERLKSFIRKEFPGSYESILEGLENE